MRWNCPHCGTELGLPDEKLDSGWTFTRCYKCSGFGLVRRPEVSLIKIDSAPNGERILLPEGTEIPRMSEEATRNLKSMQEKMASGGEPASSTATPPPFRGETTTPNDHLPEANANKVMGAMERVFGDLNGRRKMKIAMTASAAIALVSGIVLIMQGRTMWNEAREQVSRHPAVQRAPAIDKDSYAVVDSVRRNAMAPTRDNTAEQMLVEIDGQDSATLRSGPGEAYPVIGVARPGMRYAVEGWKSQWFQLRDSESGKSIGWVRNDFVK